MDSLASFIHTVKQNLDSSNNAYPNENSVSIQIVIPTLNHLGWNTTDPCVVIPEYPVKNLRVDYALVIGEISPTPKCIIEVKAVGKVDADEQLFQYAFHTGVSLAILTDGREWRFYLPMMHGAYRERLVRTFDFSSGNDKETADGIRQLLSYENTKSGKSIQSAKQISDERKQVTIAKKKISDAWETLTAGADAIFVEFLIEETSRICGYPPRREDVIGFLNNMRPTRESDDRLQPKVISPKPKGSRTVPPRETTYWLFNEQHEAKTYAVAYIHIMESLAPRLSNESLGQLQCFYRHKTDIKEPYRKTAVSVLNGKWWIHTHSSSKVKFEQVEITCAKASVEFGTISGVKMITPGTKKH